MICVMSGGSGATLVVTGVAGDTCTITNGTKTYTKTFGTDKKATFKGLATGTWTVKMTNGSKTSTRTITITADYALTIAYFSATIKVTYPAKSKAVIKNSSGTQIAWDENSGTSAKTWNATVGATGTYTVVVTATDSSGKTKSTTVSITADGQSKSVTLAYELVIYDAGSFGKNSAGTAFDVGSNDDNNASSITKNSAYMLWKCGAWAVCTFYITPKFSCAGYKTLKISLTNASTVLDSSSKGSWGLKSSNSYDNNDFVAQTNFTSLSGSQTLSLDVSNVGSTAYYIAMYFYTMQNTGSFSARVTKIWLE